jgi:hypothetical protein
MLFEKATMKKLRFDTAKGSLSVEQIWELPFTSASGVSLDDLAKKYSKMIKEGREESFVERPRPDPEMRRPSTSRSGLLGSRNSWPLWTRRRRRA